jgi:hypothetical protein
MTTRRFLLAGAIGSASLVAGCATGTRIADMAGRIPPIPAGMGRIWFYRDSSPVGWALQPSIRLNGQVVGDSVPGGAFYRDVPPGNYNVSTSTEVEHRLSFTVTAAQERFVRTSVSMGLVLGHVSAELVDPSEARQAVATKAFTGRP